MLTKTDDKNKLPEPKRITTKKLRNLLASARKTQADVSEIAGTHGELIAAAVESDHLHRKAFNVCKTADRMEPGKLWEFLYHLDHYLEDSGLRQRAQTAPRLPIDDDKLGTPDGESED